MSDEAKIPTLCDILKHNPPMSPSVLAPLTEASVMAALQKIRENAAQAGVLAPGSVVLTLDNNQWRAAFEATYSEDTPGPVPVSAGRNRRLTLDNNQWRAAFEATYSEDTPGQLRIEHIETHPTELRPPPEHAGKELHWVIAEGQKATVAQWYAEHWYFIGEVCAYPPDDPECTAYRYLGPAEWRPEAGSDQREVAKWRAAFEAAAAERDELRAKLAQRDASLLRATGRLP